MSSQTVMVLSHFEELSAAYGFPSVAYFDLWQTDRQT